jgi:predicted MPP superfamily phosphohydrolase
LAYGHGQEVLYDFGRMEMNILKDFEQRKFLSTDKDSFELIQYQMEIFTSSGNKKNFILEIRSRIKQSPFDRDTGIRIDHYFDFIENKGEEDYVHTLRDLHGGLEKILCFLQNTKEVGERTIEHFVNNKMKGSKHRVYSENTTFSQVRLMNIIALYEKLEEKYFPYVTKSIRPEYTSMANEKEIRQAVEGILNYSEVAPKGAAVNE